MLPVIKVENLSKAYQIGEFSTGTLSHDIKRWYIRKRGKEDPYLKIGEVNERTIKGISDVIWSLKNINFEINQGDAVGIIGRNGAGKSTLLKILSRITRPTTGSVKVKGRIASLLEVGTGFHPELTGRENIYLNGAILGMRKHEIKARFEEIVEFSGVQRYIDTPVKRYSSGMYVRLAFAVAAHLEPEILIVDEVLAVGDAEFQKKCLGKMKNVNVADGRTVLFVSHNMAAVQKLCDKGILLEHGTVKKMDRIESVVSSYLKMDNPSTLSIVDLKDYELRKGSGEVKFQKAVLCDSGGITINKFAIGDNITIKLYLKSEKKINNIRIGVQLYETDGTPIANMIDSDSNFELREINGEAVISVTLNDVRLYPETYDLGLYIGSSNYSEIYDHIEKALSFEIVNNGKLTSRSLTRPAGLMFLTPKWTKL